MNTNQEQDQEQVILIQQAKPVIMTGLFVFLWVLAGAIGMLYSIVCVGQQGTFNEKLGGLVVAMIAGPFYWVYFFAMRSNDGLYCRDWP
jgi:hypothetical protein